MSRKCKRTARAELRAIRDVLRPADPMALYPRWRRRTEALIGAAPSASPDLCLDVLDYLDQVRAAFADGARANP